MDMRMFAVVLYLLSSIGNVISIMVNCRKKWENGSEVDVEEILLPDLMMWQQS